MLLRKAVTTLSAIVIGNAMSCATIMLPESIVHRSANAQGALTVGAVSLALSAALDQFKQVISQAGDEFRSLGNSLQANAQNVIEDINTDLKDRLNQTFDKLDQEELRFVQDAQSLTRQIQRATELVIAKAGSEARQTISEADITAYDTLYSLPCRSQRPRIVASFPQTLVATLDSPIVTLRGDYLTSGPSLKMTLDGKDLQVLERLDHSIKVRLPESAIAQAEIDTKLVSIQISGLESIDKKLWFGLACREKRSSLDLQAAAVTLEPPIKYALMGDIRSTQETRTVVTEPPVHFGRTGSDHCDDNFDVSMQFCTAKTDAVETTGTLNVKSANCGSDASGPQPSGPRCVMVPGHVQGCGANRGPFSTWLGCKGRGWIDYDVTLNVTTKTRTDGGASHFEVAPSIAERAWSFPLPAAGSDPVFSYTATVKRTKGATLLDQWTLSSASPNAGPLSSRVDGHALAIKLTE